MGEAGEFTVCPFPLWVLLVIAAGGMICWLVRQPTTIVGTCELGFEVRAHTIEWPLAYMTLILFTSLQLAMQGSQAYLEIVRANRTPLGDLGAFLVLSVGGLGFKNVRDRRALRVVAMMSAALGLPLLSLKWSC